MKNIVEKRSIKRLKKREIVDVKLLRKTILSFTILLIHKSIQFVNIIETRIEIKNVVSLFDNYFLSNDSFEI